MTILTETLPEFAWDNPVDPDMLDQSGPAEAIEVEQEPAAENDLRADANAGISLLIGRYVAMEQVTYKNGVNHLYGVDEQGRKRHLSYDKVLAEYGRPQESPRERKERVSQTVPAVPESARPPYTAQAATTGAQLLAPLNPPVHIWPKGPETPFRKLSFGRVRSWVGEKLSAAGTHLSALPLIRTLRSRQVDREGYSQYYSPRPDRRESAKTAGLIALATGTVALIAIGFMSKDTTAETQNFPSPSGFNGDGSVVCSVLHNSEAWGQCVTEERNLKRYQQKIDTVILPHHESVPPLPTVRPRISPVEVPGFSTLSHSGDSVWSAMESISLKGHYLTSAQVAEATPIELAYNHIPAAQADQLRLNTRLRTAPAVAKLLLADVKVRR